MARAISFYNNGFRSAMYENSQYTRKFNYF